MLETRWNRRVKGCRSSCRDWYAGQSAVLQESAAFRCRDNFS